MAEKVVQEIGLSPNSGYKLIVQSTFTSLSEAVAEEALSASYEFELWQGMIEPLGEELAFSNREEVVETVTAAKLFSFFGYNISVVSARIIFSVLFLLFLTLLIYQQMKAKKNSSGVINPVAAEVRRIRKKYGNRIIEIADLKEIPAGYLQVQLYSFKDLLKLAEEREHPILQISSVDFKTSCFYTVDDNTLYVYRINLG